MRPVICAVVLAGCTNFSSGGGGPDPNPTMHQHDDRFVGLWAVTQPYHALYEQTHYWFHDDGALVTGASLPADCSGHLSEHCVTGSVANCVPLAGQDRCTSPLTCVFGAEWHSLDAATLVIAGACSDSVARPIVLAFNPDSSMNAGFGANATIVSVDGDANWSHDNWEWAFQKCPDGVEATCPSSNPFP